jgi:hypothetical protein
VRPDRARFGARGFRVALLVATVLVAGACGGTASPSPSPDDTLQPIASPVAVTTPAATATPAASGPPASDVAIDPRLLGILPADVLGVPLVENAAAEDSALGDPELAKVATSMAEALAVDPATSEFVFAVVVRLKPGVMDDAGFRDWRDSFDRGACSQSDGVSRNAETQIDGRTVYIGTCAGGVRTYHTWLQADAVLVSASSLGDRRFGEVLMEHLRP